MARRRQPDRIAILTAAAIAGCASSPTPPPPPPPPPAVAADAGVAEVSPIDAAAPDAAVGPALPTGRANEALEGGPWFKGDYVVLAKMRASRLSAGGDDIAKGTRGDWPLGPMRVALVEKAGDRLRIASVGGGVVLLLWLDPVPLQKVLVKKTSLRPRKNEAYKKTAVELAPGIEVEVVETAEALSRVRFTAGEYAFDGWVWTDAIGTQFRFDDFRYKFATDGKAKAGAAMRWKRGGRTMYRLPKGSSHGVMLNAGTGGPWTLVTYTHFCPGWLRVKGWVRSTRVRKVEPTSGGGGCGIGNGGDKPQWGQFESNDKVAVPKGSWLVDPKTNEIVGRVWSDRAKLRKHPDGGVIAATPWGPAVLEIAKK